MYLSMLLLLLWLSLAISGSSAKCCNGCAGVRVCVNVDVAHSVIDFLGDLCLLSSSSSSSFSFFYILSPGYFLFIDVVHLS